MKHLKRVTAFLLCLMILLPLFPVESRAEGSGLSEYWIYDKEDLAMLYTAASEYVVTYGSSSITFCFSKKLVDKYTVDKLVYMATKAGNMVSVDGLTVSYWTMSDGTLRVELANMKIRSGEKMLEAWIYGDRSKLTSEEKKCLDKVVKVMKSLTKKYPKTSLELETAIYDYICDHVSYKNYSSKSSKREACTSACNAFMNGWGNCQAYSDLFRLMATIGGFNTGLISGKTDEGHMWNWIGTWFDGEYRVYMVDVTYGDHGKKKKADHYYMNFGLDRAKDRTWPKELFTYDEFEQKTEKSCTYYGSKGFTAKKLDDAAKKCAKLARKGKKRVEFLVYEKGIWEKEIQAALKKHLRINSAWHFKCYKHDKGVTVVFWW